LHGPLLDEFPNIARLGDMRQVNLGLEFLGRGRWTGAAASAAAGLGILRKIPLYTLRFIHFNRAGVRFLFRYTDLDENVEDLFALYLKFPRQIIDSNLRHAALLPPYCAVGYDFIASSP
jgi:hypothetical protein